MDKVCCVTNCTNKASDDNGVSFHRFPLHEPELLKHWISCIHKEDWQPTKYSFVCSVHFPEGSFTDEENCILNDDAVPVVDHYSSNTSPSKRMKFTVQHGCKFDSENGLSHQHGALMTEQQSGQYSEANDFSSSSPENNKMDENSFVVNDAPSHETDDAVFPSPVYLSDDSLIESSILSEESQNYSDGSETFNISPVISTENGTVQNFGSMEIKLNTEDDYPDGSWLGNENKPELRVRCSLNPLELAYVNTTCCTPKKMALALVNRLFQFNFRTPSDFLQARKMECRSMLDPLLMYGIQCHLISLFGINNEAWKELKWIIDSKCLAILNRHMEVTSTSNKPTRNEPARGVNRKTRRVGPAQLEFLSSSSKAKVRHIRTDFEERE